MTTTTAPIRAAQRTADNGALSPVGRKRTKRQKDYQESVDGLQRAVRGLGRAVLLEDPGELTRLAALRDEVDRVIGQAALAFYESGEFSWGEIARQTGLGSRQAARQKWGKEVR